MDKIWHICKKKYKKLFLKKEISKFACLMTEYDLNYEKV